MKWTQSAFAAGCAIHGGQLSASAFLALATRQTDELGEAAAQAEAAAPERHMRRDRLVDRMAPGEFQKLVVLGLRNGQRLQSGFHGLVVEDRQTHVVLLAAAAPRVHVDVAFSAAAREEEAGPFGVHDLSRS